MSTDNAYVQAHVVQITPQVGGHGGRDPGRRHRPREGRPAAGQAGPRRRPRGAGARRGALAQTVREVRTLYANNAHARGADRAARGRGRAPAGRAGARQGRREPPQRRWWPAARSARKNSSTPSTQLAAAQQRAGRGAGGAGRGARAASANQALTDGTAVDDHPDVQRAAARVREAYWRCSAPRCRRRWTGRWPSARADRPARGRRRAADDGDPAGPGLGRRQLQGSASCASCASASR